MLEDARKQMATVAAAEGDSTGKAVARPTAKSLSRNVHVNEALAMVRADLGPFNWLLLTPDPKYAA